MLILDNFDESILGANTPDPLRFAFQNKHSAHAGGIAMPVPSHEQANVWQHITQQVSQRQQVRCLYIHVPFVEYAVLSVISSKTRRVASWWMRILQRYLKRSNKSGTALDTNWRLSCGLYWRGTPTELSPEQIRQLGTAIRESFPLTPDCEITLEGRIHRFSDEMFENALEGALTVSLLVCRVLILR